MKNPKSTIALALLFAGVMTLVLQNQPAVSQHAPPPLPPVFALHYSTRTFTLAPGEASAPIPVPVLDRAVRIVVTVKFADGAIHIADLPCAYNTSDGSFQIAFANGVSYYGSLDFGSWFNIAGGTNGTYVITNISPDEGSGSFHIAMWY